MSRRPKFPLTVRHEASSVKIYRERSASSKTGWNHRVTWVGAAGVESFSRADPEKAIAEAKIKARQLAGGEATALHFQSSDLVELQEARRLADEIRMPLLAALAELRRARELAGPGVLEACEAWAMQRVQEISRITIHDAIEGLINTKIKAKKEGERTYRSKLTPIEEKFGQGTFLDTLSQQRWQEYLDGIDDAVTRNDLRKRAVTLCRWAQKRNHLHPGLLLEIEKTERATEEPKPIGIISPETYEKLLNHFYTHHREYLAALVLAGFAGLRSDEIHGKRKDRSKRQRWEHIYLDQHYLMVSAAKTNTPSNRPVQLCEAALAWLRLCPNRKDNVCTEGAMEKVRALAIAAKFTLPPNCFRHSYITYAVAVTGNKDKVSHEAGNSPAEIDRRYRVPQPPEVGARWFAIMPPAAAKMPRRRSARNALPGC